MTNIAGSSAQRIRIGLTGLAFAFLLVLLGSVISRSGDDPDAEQAAAEVSANDGVPAEPTEPLAELGVAPGAAGQDNSDAAADLANQANAANAAAAAAGETP